MDAVTNEQEAIVASSVRQVFRAISTRDLATAWQWHLLSAEQTSAGLPHVGAETREVERVLGLPLSASSTLVALEEDRTVTWRTRSALGTIEASFSLSPHEGGCLVKSRAVLWPRVRIPGWYGPAARWLSQRVASQLDRLRGWMEVGIVDAPDHAHGLLARLVQRATHRRLRFGVRSQPVSPMVVAIEVDRTVATCQMHCHFCPRTAANETRDLPAPDPATLDRVYTSFERAVYASTAPLVTLWSDDILRYPDLFRLLSHLQREGREAVLHTPGLSLADRSFAERFVGLPVRFDITVHADDEAAFTAMCGNPDAHRLVHRALDNLHELGIGFDLAVVVTARNVHRLGPTLRLLVDKFAPPSLQIRLFYPDAGHLGPAYEDQFPLYTEVIQQLASADRLPQLHITNLPVCQVEPNALGGLNVLLTQNRNSVRTYPLPACEGCEAREVCPGLHPVYARRFPVVPPNRAHIADIIAKARASKRPPTPAPGGGEFGRVTLPGIEVVVERRRDHPYWLSLHDLGIWYWVTDASMQPIGEAALQRTRARLEQPTVDGTAALEILRSSHPAAA